MNTLTTKTTNKGFSLIELIVVFGIIAIFAGLGMAYFNQFTNKKKTETESRKLADVLELAKKKASASDIPTSLCVGTFQGYQVKITTTNYDLRIKCDLNPTPDRYQLVQSYGFDNMVTANVGINGVTVDFPPLDQPVVVNPNNQIMLLNNDHSSCFSVTVNAVGRVTEIPIDCQLPG